MKYLSKDQIVSEVYTMRNAYLNKVGLDVWTDEAKKKYLTMLEKQYAKLKIKTGMIRNELKDYNSDAKNGQRSDCPF